MDITNDGTGAEFSLADLAGVDVTSFEEVRFVQIPPGAYEFEVSEAGLHEDEKDGERRFRAEFKIKIVGVKAVLKSDVDKESLIGREHTERLFIKPGEGEEEVKKQIGRIRAFIADIGCGNEGNLGDIVENTKGHGFTAKMGERADKDDKSVKYARLMLDPAKK